ALPPHTATAAAAAPDGIVLRIGTEEWSQAKFRWLVQAEELPEMASADLLRPQIAQIAERRLLARAGEAAGVAQDPLIEQRLSAARARILAFAEKERLHAIAPVDAATVRAAFVARPDALDELRLSHILVRIGTGNSPDAVQHTEVEAAARIQSVRAELARGADFAILARKYSEDAESAGEGGALPEIHREDLKPSVAPAVRALRRGEVSAPVRGVDGYHLIRLDEVKPATVETKGRLLEYNLREKWVQQQVDALLAANPVTFDPSIAGLAAR
ncbi:MAG TPA: peptidylprolyl isomerase, partial [Sphingomonas sp.]|nr:peptidylprolyl isomerase [Sphingomonas sp.]